MNAVLFLWLACYPMISTEVAWDIAIFVFAVGFVTIRQYIMNRKRRS